MSLRTDGHWLRNGPCDHCGSRDNRARYSDGSEFCFGCRDFTPPSDRPMYTPKGETVIEQHFTDRSPTMALANREWLQRFISDDEIDEFFYYDLTHDRHVFAHNVGEEDWFYEGRSVNGALPKSMQRGTKPFLLLGPWKETGTIVIVEDIVSAIKVSRHYGAIPLFGSHMGIMHIGELVKKRCKEVIVWLDEDKYAYSIQLARKIGLVKPCTVISTPEDPKACTDARIIEEVTDAIEALEAS